MLLQSSLPSSVEAALSFTSDHGKRDLTFEWINAETRQFCINCNELSQDGSELLTANTTFETSGSSYICKRRKLLKNSVVIFPLEAEVNVVTVFAVKNGPSDIQVEDTIDDGTGAPSLSAEKSVFEFNSANASILNSHKFSKSPCSKFKFSIKPDVNTKSKFVSFGKDLRSDCSLREPDIQVGSVIKTNEANHITESLNHDIQVNVVPVFAVRNDPSVIQVEDTIDDGTGAPSLSTEKSVFEFNSANASILNSHKFSKSPCSKFKFSIKPYLNTKSKSISFGKDLISDCSLREPEIQVGSVIKTNEANHITESLNHDIQGSKVSNEEELFLKDLCISVLRSNGLLEPVCPKISCASRDILGIGSDRGYTQSCKQCSLSENILNMLRCDQCEEAFHVSCCKPRLRMLLIDEWFCHSCSKMNCSPSNKNSFSKSCITRSYTASRFGLGPIAHMLKHTEHYTSKVRIGEDFQARVPDWCDQISNDVNCIGEPSEMDPAETIDIHASFSIKFPKPKSVSNWLQCCEVLYDDSRERVKGTICGKWRRAPFAKVQTDDWDCSCAVLWDPAHADCAVPQELETEQVLLQLKQIEKLNSRLASKMRELQSCH